MIHMFKSRTRNDVPTPLKFPGESQTRCSIFDSRRDQQDLMSAVLTYQQLKVSTLQINSIYHVTLWMRMCSFQCQSGITPYCTKQCSGLRMSTCCLPVRTHLVKACVYHKQHLHLTTLGLTIKHQERTKNTNPTSLQEFMTVQVWVFTLQDVCWSWKSLSHLSVLSLLRTFYLAQLAQLSAADQINIFHHTSALAVHPQMPCCFKEWGNEPAWQSGLFSGHLNEAVELFLVESFWKHSLGVHMTSYDPSWPWSGSLKRFYQLPWYLRLWQE